jgi:fibronectin-binding autotransporter adhesin
MGTHLNCSRVGIIVCVFALSILLSAAFSPAATFTWDPGTNTNWSITDANWWDSGTSSAVAWPSTLSTAITTVAEFGSGKTAIPTGTVTVSVTGIYANGMLFDSTVVPTYTISGSAITLGGTTPTINVTDASITATISSVIAGNLTGGLVKSGPGTLILAGTDTYLGGTTVNGGTLVLANTSALASPSSGSTVLVNGSGTLTLSATASGDVTYNTNTITGSGLLKVYAPSATSNSSTANINGAFTGFTGTIDIRPNGDVAGMGKTRLTSVLPSALPSSSVTVKIENGATLYLAPGNGGKIYNFSVQLYGAANGEGLGALRVDDRATFAGSVTLYGNSSIGSNSGGAVFSGVIGESGGSYSLTKQGGSDIFLTNANNYTGATLVNAGTLYLGKGGATGAISSSSPITVTATLGFYRSDNITVSNTITGAGTLLKQGTNTVTITGASGFAGTTSIFGGTLKIGDGTSGSLTSTGTVSISQFGQGGTVIFDEGAGVSQTIAVLNANGGYDTIQSTYTSGDPIALTFGAYNRGAGGVANFVVSGGTNGTDNKIVLSALTGPTFINQGTFFNGGNYAWYDTGGYVREIVYGTDVGTLQVTTTTTLSGSSYIQVTGSGQISGQTTLSIATLNIDNSNPVSVANANTLSLDGILLSSGNSATISGDATSTAYGIQTATAGADLVIRIPGASDTLTVSANILSNPSITLTSTTYTSLTKSGPGTLALSGTNTYTGATYVNGGTLSIYNANSIGTGANGGLTITGTGCTINNAAGALITLAGNRAISLYGDVSFTGSNITLGTGTITIGGVLGQHTITVGASQTVTAGGVSAGFGYGLNKAGDGTLVLNTSASNIYGNVNIQGTITSYQDFNIYNGTLTGSGTIINGNTAAKWIRVYNSDDCTFDGLITTNPASTAGRFGLAKSGAGKLTLTNTANVINDVITIEQGTLVFTGSHRAQTANEFIGTSYGTGTLYIDSPTAYYGTSTGYKFYVGSAGYGNGVIILKNGLIECNNTSGSALVFGTWTNNASGFLNMSGGTVQITANAFFLGASNSGAFAAMTQSGGLLKAGANTTTYSGVYNISGGEFRAAGYLQLGTDAGSWGVINLSGGSMNFNGAGTSTLRVSDGGTGVLNVTGGVLTITSTTTTGGLRMCNSTTSTNGIVNLLGGTVATPIVTAGTTTTAMSMLNFNGGTLKATKDISSFITSDVQNVIVWSGGAVIDSGGKSITIDHSMLAPTGKGIQVNIDGSPVGISVSGSGYIDTPIVKITNAAGDTSGKGATAVAIIDSNGNLTGIKITNPGIGYTAAPEFTLYGGGYGNSGMITGAATLVANSTAGTFTKTGDGSVTVTGAHTYTGQTTVSGGSLILGPGFTTNTSGFLVNGSKLVQSNTATLTQTVTVTNGLMDGTTTAANVVVNGTGGGAANGNGTATQFNITDLSYTAAGSFGLISLTYGTLGGNTTPDLEIGTLTLASGLGQISVNAALTSPTLLWNPDTYYLVHYGTGVNVLAGSFKTGTITGITNRQTGVVSHDTTNHLIVLTVSGDNPVWTGATSDKWTVNVATDLNWYLYNLNPPKSTYYQEDPVKGNDVVRFDDRGTANPTVDISSGNVSPTRVYFNNTSSLTYTITSSSTYGIAGTGSVTLTDSCSGQVTIGTNNSYTGGTEVYAGKLIMTGNNNFTAGAMNVKGGTLTLSGSNDYTSNTVINSGVLNINNDHAIGTGTLVINGGTIDNSTDPVAVSLNSANPQNWNEDFYFGGTGDLDLGTGTVTMGGTRTITLLGTAGATLTVGGSISQTVSPSSLVVSGASTVTSTLRLTGSNGYTGPTTIHGGTLEVAGGVTGTTANTNNTITTPSIIISPDAADTTGTFKVSGGTVNADRVLISGTYNNSGTPGTGFMIMEGGVVNSYEWFSVGSGATSGGTGTLTMKGGTINQITQRMEVGNFTGASGTIDMSDGQINFYTNTSMTLGTNGGSTGIVNQSGGTVAFYSDAGTTIGGTGVLNIGLSASSSGTYSYNLNGGLLIVPSVTHNTSATAAGVLNLNGGTIRAARANATWIQNVTVQAGLGRAIIDDGGYAVTMLPGIAYDPITLDNGIVKQGTGTLTMAGESTYYGPTTVSAGTLLINSTGLINNSLAVTIDGSTAKFAYCNTTTPLATSIPVTVVQGTLGGTGTVGTATVSDGTGGIIANGDPGTEVFTITNLTFDGAGAVNLNTASTPTSNLPVLVVSNLATSGGGGVSTGKVTFNAYNSVWYGATVYKMISYDNYTGPTLDPKDDIVKGTISGLTGRQDASITTVAGAPNYICVSVTNKDGSNNDGSVAWTGKVGGVDNANWQPDVLGLDNWKLGSGAVTNFQTDDRVHFNDTAPGPFTVDISAGNVSTVGVIFDITANISKSYVIMSSGGFGITSGYVQVNGGGTVTISTSNTYAGDTTLNAGRLNIDNTSAIGTGTLVVNGGTLGTGASNIVLSTNNPQQWNGDFTFAGPSNLDLGTAAVILSLGTRSVNVTTGTLAVGSITSSDTVATSGYNLTKAGAGTLAITSTANTSIYINGTLNITGGTVAVGSDPNIWALSGTTSGVLTNGNTTSGRDKWIRINNNTDCTFDGVITSNSTTTANVLGIYKLGTGSLTLTNTANVVNNAVNVNSGTLVFTGSHNNSGQVDNVGTVASTNAILVLNPNTTFTSNYGAGGNNTTSMSIATNASSVGTIRIDNATTTLAMGSKINVGIGGYGSIDMTAGQFTSYGFLCVGGSGGSRPNFVNQSGGTITVTNAPCTIGWNWTASYGVLNFSGNAVFNTSSLSGNGIWLGETGTGVGILNVSGNATVNINSGGTITGGGGLVFARADAGCSGMANLNGGVVNTPFVTKGTGASGIINFNGGTLKATASNTTFMTGLTAAYVYSGGAKIDDGGNTITIGQALIAPVGGGVSIPTVFSVTSSGYITAPAVTISGEGTGATAVATIDSSGQITAITVTNPGINYTTATISVAGGGAAGAYTGDTTLSVATNSTAGGLTKYGSGTVILTATNTYGGNTTVNNGTLQATIPDTIPNYAVAGKVVVNTGAMIALNVGGTTDWTAAQANALDIAANYSTGSFIGFDTTNTPVDFDYSAYAIGGVKGVKKLAINNMILGNATSNYTGPTYVNSGTLIVTSLNAAGLASSIGAATADASNLVILDTLKYTGAGSTTNRLFTVGSAATLNASGTGAVNFNGVGSVAFASTSSTCLLTLTGTNTGDNAISAILGDVSTSYKTSLTKSGAGKWVLAGANTYTGATTVSAGTLELSSTGQIDAASAITTAASTATFQVNGGTHTVGTISGPGKTNLLANSTVTATSVVQSSVTLGNGATLTIAPIAGGPQSDSSSLSAVPEPTTWTMLLLAAMGLGIYWRRSR